MRDKYDYNFDPKLSSICYIFKLVQLHDIELDINYVREYQAFKITVRKDGYAYSRYLTEYDLAGRDALQAWDTLNHTVRKALYSIECEKKLKTEIYADDNTSSGLLEE